MKHTGNVIKRAPAQDDHADNGASEGAEGTFGFRDAPAGDRKETFPHDKEKFLEALEQNADWQPAWLRAIALAWQSDEYKRELTGNPREFLRKYCHYELPRYLELKIEEDPSKESAFDPGTPGGAAPAENWVWHLPLTHLTMYLPPKPKDEGVAPVALAAYEAIGKTYPFTTLTC
jgi:ribosomally synthesized peptide (two-chain TOMM family)